MTTIIAEAATGHGGDLDIAADMVRAAADSGATYVKFQTYDLAKLNPADPQAEWLKQAHLDKADHELLMRTCEQVGIQFLSTPFDAGSLQMLRELGLTTFKVASSESGNDWWQTEDPPCGESWFVSWPWGLKQWREDAYWLPRIKAHLTAIPLYPTPPECIGRAAMLDGYSCHAVGIEACQMALSCGATVIEAHMKIEGRGRNCAWDKTPKELRQLRDFADKIETMRAGVSTQFRQRWSK